MDTEPFISIAAAAKAISIDRNRLRRVCIQARVAIWWGGSDEHPRLKVKLSEARKAIEACKYAPAGREAKPLPASRAPSLRLTELLARTDLRC